MNRQHEALKRLASGPRGGLLRGGDFRQALAMLLRCRPIAGVGMVERQTPDGAFLDGRPVGAGRKRPFEITVEAETSSFLKVSIEPGLVLGERAVCSPVPTLDGLSLAATPRPLLDVPKSGEWFIGLRAEFDFTGTATEMDEDSFWVNTFSMTAVFVTLGEVEFPPDEIDAAGLTAATHWPGAPVVDGVFFTDRIAPHCLSVYGDNGNEPGAIEWRWPTATSS